MSAQPQQSGPVVFRVPGKPVPQGSMKAFVVRGHAHVTHTKTQELNDWRAKVSIMAKQAGAYVMGGAVRVEVMFRFPRPKAHFGTGKNADKLKSSASLLPAVRPDIDKLVRAVLDSLTGVCFTDDCQVTDVQARKEYTDDAPETFVRVVPL